jgi:hypothetical protein
VSDRNISIAIRYRTRIREIRIPIEGHTSYNLEPGEREELLISIRSELVT